MPPFGVRVRQAVGLAYPRPVLDLVLIGAGFAFAAAVQPGPLQAYLFSQVAAVGWRRTLPAAVAPLISDGPIAVLALFVLGRFPGQLQHGLRAAGGVLLLFLALVAYRRWSAGSTEEARNAPRAPRSLTGAVLVNLINPNPYLGWTLILGPTAMTAWRRSPVDATALIVAFYVTMITTTGALILLFGTTRFLGPRTRRALVLLSAVILATIGLYQLVVGVARLVGG